jgi:CheY-like chemotaxis protein
LADKTAEAVRLTEVLSSVPQDGAARTALVKHLSDLQMTATELGLVHLGAALDETLSRLERESFGPGSLAAVQALAQRYGSLAAMTSHSGTHRVVPENAPSEDTLQPVADARLRGRIVLVADDEAEVRWLYVGLLREAGARVVEARDGAQALELALGDRPDLILADIVMPRLDGLGLCAAVRREPALDGVPVVLLSWRDDFLHRMRELQANAQGYLRKEVSARQVLDQVSGALEPITKLERLLEGELDVQGDLEAVGVSGLLRAIRRLRPDASVVIQDCWSLFELELHDGRIVDVTRTAIDGAITKGAAALPALVGMSSGRFIVAQRGSELVVDGGVALDGAFASTARRLGTILTSMARHPEYRIEFDEDVLGTYVRHCPARIQELIALLVTGQTPQALWESGAESRSLLDPLLVTLARQGAIRDVLASVRALESTPSAGRTAGHRWELNARRTEQDFRPVVEPIERENVRAQSAVAMQQEPANRVTSSAHPVWRLSAGTRAHAGAGASGFELELHTTSRLLGSGFLVLLSATVVFLVWVLLAPPLVPRARAPAEAPAASATRIAAGAEMAAPPAGASPAGFEPSDVSGTLRFGVDPSLQVGESQGVLELIGSSEIEVEVNGIERGSLPLTVVLDQGRHAVRYRFGPRATYRFYYIQAGTTRAVRAVNQPGGLIDAR